MKIHNFTICCVSIHNGKVVNFIKLSTLPLLLLLSLLLLVLTSLLPPSLYSSPLSPPHPQKAISGFHPMASGYGPEDMVIDSSGSSPRLLVSCASRRPEYPVYGEIETIDPIKGSRNVMLREGEPAGLIFRPHGISLVQEGEVQYLYVISHNDSLGIHPIIQYQVETDKLIFIKLLTSKLLASPNALQAFPNGSILVCNDAADRKDMKEKIFRQKKGNILFYDGQGNWSIVADKLGMPAGLTGIKDQIFVSAALENKLYSFQLQDGQLTDKKVLCRIKGPDNIRINKGNLLVTSHSKPVKFILHTKNKDRKSPSLVWSVDPRTGKSKRVFYDTGKRISASSVALFFNNQLIIGQIFEPFIGILDFHQQ